MTPGLRKTPFLLATLAIALSSYQASAQDAATTYGPPAPNDEASAAAEVPEAPIEAPRRRYPIFPIGAKGAMERGYSVQRGFGMSAMLINNVQNMNSNNLAIAFGKGEDPPIDTTLIETPFVTTDRMKSDTDNSQFKADLWIFPFLNLFGAIGKAKGDIDISVNIDVDAFVPFPFCRPAKPCGTVNLPFTANVDNTTFTIGSILAYGSKDWAAMAVMTRTWAVASTGDRSDIDNTDISARIGPRFEIGNGLKLMPYAGVNYFDMDVTVNGVVRSGPFFEDGDSINLRYRVDLKTAEPWSLINGVNLELGPRWAVQAEYDWWTNTDRFVLSLTFRP